MFGNLVDPTDEHFVDAAVDCPGQLHPFFSFTSKCPAKAVPSLAIRSPFNGTLFRLALRTASAAQLSQISSESFTADKFLQTLHTFIETAPDTLLFTKHVKTISVYIKDSVDNACNLLHKSTASASNLSSLADCQLQKVNISVQHASDSPIKQVWVKATHSAAGRTNGDVAVLVQDSSKSAVTTLPNLVGQVYSVLALPLGRTCLPVHINGAFSMSSDRRTLVMGQGNRGQVSRSMHMCCSHGKMVWHEQSRG